MAKGLALAFAAHDEISSACSAGNVTLGSVGKGSRGDGERTRGTLAFVLNLMWLQDKPRVVLSRPPHVQILKNLWADQIWISLNSSSLGVDNQV